jgi:acyl-CoA synthetase (AMP-forming)/AMP-acid ligase II
LPGTEVRCADAQGRSVPPGEPGEVLLRGYHVMQGYFEDEAATREAIDADGWLHTGDVGVMDERGYLRITDRLKDMYITGGFNCYPAEIERLMAPHPAVAQVAVIGVPDERLGEVGCAFVVRRPAADAERSGLHRLVPPADGQLQGAAACALRRRAADQRVEQGGQELAAGGLGLRQELNRA